MSLKVEKITPPKNPKNYMLSSREKHTRSFFFQPKLSICPNDDVYEREADTVADQVMRMPEKKDQPFFLPQPIAIKPLVQTKCAACEEEEQLQRKEEESEEENVMLKSATTHTSGADDDKANNTTVQRQESPPESTTPDKKPETTSAPGINWFEMSRPFLTRGAGNLLFDPSAFGSISQQWNYNYNLFNFFGLGTGLSREASNFFTPFAIDSALKRDFPLPWEIMDRELNTSTIMISPTIFNFDLGNLRKSFTMPSPLRGIFGLPENPYTIQRKCSTCEEEKRLQKKDSTSGSGDKDQYTLVNDVIHSSGRPLDSSTRSTMEGRFGYDFSNVKIHTSDIAAKSAQSINALAYTSGNNIVFNDGQYSLGTDAGQKLLAHELTHVVQQGQALPSQYVQRDSIYEDVASVNANHPGGIYSGTVDRYEYNDQAAYNARIANNRTNIIHHGNVNVRFDSNRCVLEVPVSVQFVNQSAANRTTCGDITGQRADPVKSVSSSTFTSAIPRIINTLNSNLNGWFSIRLGNPQVAGCRAPTVPIRVIVTQVTSNPDYTVIITGNSGRSYVSGNTMVMCGSDVSDESIITHEAGHFVLGHGDEYHERTVPRPRSRERLGQYSYMAQDAPPRLLEFLERHFNFASEFMNTAFPGCNASLVQGTRERAIEANFYLNEGLFVTSSNSALMLSLGAKFGIPLTPMRRLSLQLGPNVNLLVGDMTALMAGVRAGLEYKTGIGHALGSTWGFRAGLHGEAGGMLNFGPGGEGLPRTNVINTYVEGGANLGLSFDSRFFVGAEGGIGKISNPSTSEIRYYHLGLTFGVSI